MARKNYRNLDREVQLALASEIVATRSAELCLAYENVVGLAYGLRLRVGSNQMRRVTDTVCVCFVVREKWTATAKVDRKQTIPKELFAYATINGERRLCAVPTDVESAEMYMDAGPSGHREIVDVSQSASNGKSVRAVGALACLVQRPEFKPDQTWALSCRHVLSLSLKGNSRLSSGLPVKVRTNRGTTIGKTTAVRGPLRTSGYSFDAQLLKVSNLKALQSTLAGISYDDADSYANGLRDIPGNYFVLVPRPSGSRRRSHAAIPLSMARIHSSHTLSYGGRINGQVTHRIVIESRANGPQLGPFPGDSGSPVVTRPDGGVLLGMHFGGKKSGGLSFMIPAWQLLNPRNYGRSREVPWKLSMVLNSIGN